MADDLSIVDRIRANAELVVSVAANQLGEAVGYDEAGVRWLDGYIQRQHEQGDPSKRNGLVNMLGSYLGELIIRSFGGEWTEADGTWCVQFDARNMVYPFAKAAKHLERGAEESVLSFFTFIPLMFRRDRSDAQLSAGLDPSA